MAIGVLSLLPSAAEFPNTVFAAPQRTVGTNLTFWELLFDSATDEAAFWYFHVPENYGGGPIAATLYWKAAATSGVVRFGVATRSVTEGSTWDFTFTEAVVDDTVQGTTEQVGTASLTPGGAWTSGQLAQVRVRRLGSASEDTMGGDAKLLGVKLTYTAV